MSKRFSVGRARLLAAAAIAGLATFQACTAEQAKVKHAGTAGDVGAPDTNSTAGTSMNAGGQAGQPSSQGGAAGDAVGGAAGATEAGAAGHDLGGAGPGGAGPGGAGAGGASGAGGAAACDDSTPTPSCADVSAACTPYCNAALANLKPAVADDAVTCLKLDATANCFAGYGCLSAATAKGCPEDVATACTAAAATCTEAPDPTNPSCEQLLSGFTDAARAAVIGCTVQSCFTVYRCAKGFFFQ